MTVLHRRARRTPGAFPTGVSSECTPAARLRHAVIEALESFATPDLADALARIAFSSIGLAAPPEDGDALESFVRGPLRRTVLHALGAEASELVMRDLLPIAERLKSATPAIRHRAPARGRVILAATKAASRVSHLRSAAGEDVEVVQATDLVELIDSAQHCHRPPILVIDCASPSIQVPTMALVVPDLPVGTHLILWEITPTAEDELIRLGDVFRRWARIPPGDEPGLENALASLL